MSNATANDDLVPSSSWREWTCRLQAYTDWLNVQLRKNKDNRSVADLSHDLQDGVVVAQLVEALGGESVIGIDLKPTSPASRKENVERIFQHFSAKRVPISYCRVKDVLAGDLKCTMRLIHSVASHYRPESVLQPPNSSGVSWGHHSRCSSTFYENNMTSLGGRQKNDGRKVSGGSVLPIRKQPSIRECPKLTSTLSSLALDNNKRSPLRKSFTSLTCDRFSRSRNLTGKDAPPKISCKVAPFQLTSGNVTPLIHCSPLPVGHKLNKKRSSVSKSQPCSLDSVDNKYNCPVDVKKTKTCSCSNLNYGDVEQLLKKVEETKEQLLLLQDVLLHSNGGKFLKESEHDIPYGSGEDIITPRSVLNESKENANSNRKNHGTEPLSMVKKLISYMSICGERKSMMSDENRNSTFGFDEVDEGDWNYKLENTNLRKTIEEKDQEIKKLKAALSNQLPNFDKKSSNYPFSSSSSTQREELQVVHDALTSLRICFPVNSKYQHTLDTVEQSLSALLERVNVLEIGNIPTQSPPPMAPDSGIASVHRTNYIPSNESVSHPVSKLSSFNIQRLDDLQKSTKVVYYMGKAITPFRCILNRRIGEATLMDFKLLFDRPGQYRYHFKTLDPEFGMVKQEVLHDDDIVPGWDGKIIAWIEEDCS